jgi:hypothetical protein
MKDAAALLDSALQEKRSYALLSKLALAKVDLKAGLRWSPIPSEKVAAAFQLESTSWQSGAVTKSEPSAKSFW